MTVYIIGIYIGGIQFQILSQYNPETQAAQEGKE
jgi:hypothetical protein